MSCRVVEGVTELMRTTGISSGKEGVMNKSGAAGLSRRVSGTPIIAAVNGLCFGGGMEIVVNCTQLSDLPEENLG